MYTVCWEDGFQSHLLVVDSNGTLVARAHTYWQWLYAMGLADFLTTFPEASVSFEIPDRYIRVLIENSEF